MTHPHHPLCGQRVDVVRVRRGADPDLIICLSDGRHAAIALSWTDAGLPTEPERFTGPVPLLAIEGLRQIASLVARRGGADDGAGKPNEAGRCSLRTARYDSSHQVVTL